jgi:hypothetical protein
MTVVLRAIICPWQSTWNWKLSMTVHLELRIVYDSPHGTENCLWQSTWNWKLSMTVHMELKIVYDSPIETKKLSMSVHMKSKTAVLNCQWKMKILSVTVRLKLSIVRFICFDISSSEKCLRVSKTERYGLSRICCFEMTGQAIMPLSSEKCLPVSKTESYGLSRICFEMTRQATMPSLKAWLCLADEQHIWQSGWRCWWQDFTPPFTAAWETMWVQWKGPKNRVWPSFRVPLVVI